MKMIKGWIQYWIVDPFWGGLDFLAFTFLRLFSVKQVSSAGAFIGRVARHRFKQAMQDTDANLKFLQPDLTADERQSLSNSMWENIARSLTEMAVLDKFDLKRDVMENNLDVLRKLDKNRPVVFIFPHLGNWELLALSVLNQGFRLNVMFETVPNRFQRRLLVASRRRTGYTLITPDFAGTRTVFRAMGRGEALGIAVDEFKCSRIISPAFNHPVSEQSNLNYAVELARRFHAPLVIGYCKRIEATRFEINCLDPFDLDEPENRSDKVVVEKINEILKGWVIDNLDQWYMLHRARLNKSN